MEVVEKTKPNILITLNSPLIGCISGAYVKRKFGDTIRFIVYDVDSFSNSISSKCFSIKQKQRMMWKWEKIIFKAADLVIVMRNHAEHYSQDRYCQFQNKIRIANFPMLYSHLSDINYKQTDSLSKTQCVYLGTLSQTYRNPQIVCELFSRIPNIDLKFFGKIDNAETIIKKYSEKTQGKIHHDGMVSFSHGQKILQNSDVLISIGNHDSDMVPSKTYEYMSFCKPIIHLYTFKEDPVISILSQYPIVLLLDSNESVQALVEKTEEFLNANIGKTVDLKNISNLLRENTPEYSIDLIEHFFNNL